jgi:N-acetylmuramoyl-L-alanine amidase
MENRGSYHYPSGIKIPNAPKALAGGNDLRKNIKGKSNYLWLFDAGHGGLLNGKYTTAPAKMHTFHPAPVGPGFVIYEGVVNREITDRIARKLDQLDIDYQYIHDPVEDTGLSVRVIRADAAYHKDSRAVFVSIHSNAGGGSGIEVFTSPGQTKSDKIANIFCSAYERHFKETKLRCDKTDGDADKEADFYVLRKTDCPAILVENFFFDNRMEAEFLVSVAGQEAIATCIVDAIKTCEQLKPI